MTGVQAAHLKSMEERLVPWLSSLGGMGMMNPLGLVSASPSPWAASVPMCRDSCAKSLRSMGDRMASAGWTGRSSDAPSGPAQQCWHLSARRGTHRDFQRAISGAHSKLSVSLEPDADRKQRCTQCKITRSDWAGQVSTELSPSASSHLNEQCRETTVTEQASCGT